MGRRRVCRFGRAYCRRIDFVVVFHLGFDIHKTINGSGDGDEVAVLVLVESFGGEREGGVLGHGESEGSAGGVGTMVDDGLELYDSILWHSVVRGLHLVVVEIGEDGAMGEDVAFDGVLLGADELVVLVGEECAVLVAGDGSDVAVFVGVGGVIVEKVVLRAVQDVGVVVTDELEEVVLPDELIERGVVELLGRVDNGETHQVTFLMIAGSEGAEEKRGEGAKDKGFLHIQINVFKK